MLSEIYIFLEAHIKKIIVIIMILALFHIKNEILDIITINVINSNLKTKTLLFKDSGKNSFIIRSSTFSGKKKEVILSSKEEKLLKKEKIWKNLNISVSLLCLLLPLGLILRRSTSRGKGSLLAKGVDIFYPKKYKGTNVISYNSKEGIILGNYAGKKIIDNSQTHVLIEANTGAGKDVGPVIMTHIEGWKNSMVTADLKGDIYEKTAGYRQKVMKNVCFFLDFSDYKSCNYNPFIIIKKGSKMEVDYSKLIANNIVTATTGFNDKDQFWRDSAVILLQGITLFSLYTVKDRTIDITDINNFLNKEDLKEYVKKLKATFKITKDEVLKISEYYPEAIDLLSQYKHPEIERAFNGILNTPSETFTGVLMTLKTTLSHFLGSVTKQVVTGNTFIAKDITFYKKPITLYLKIDFKQIEILLPLLNIIIGSITMELLPKEQKGKEFYRNKRPVAWFFNEFTSFGRIPIVEKIITFTRSFYLKFIFAIQDATQLNNVYGPNNSFWSNCKTKLFFNIDDDKDNIKIISELTGTRTVLETPPVFGGTLFGNRGFGTRGNYIEQKVLTVEDIRGMKPNKAILLMGNKTAIINKNVYFTDKEIEKRTRIVPEVDRL
jgi:type IV secretory pathway TraG/TraD family ATPase VirD4